MKPLLAHVYEPHRISYPCYVQPKLNGIRALYQAGRFQSRDEIPFPEGLLDHLAKPLLECFEPQVILDGELYVHGWPLQKILGAVTPVATKRGVTEDTLCVEYWVFDSVDYTKSFFDRFSYVFGKGNGMEGVNFVTTVPIKDNGWDDSFYANTVADGFEGIMYRLGDCPYTDASDKRKSIVNPRAQMSDQDNRVWHMLKRKSWQDDEFEIIDFAITTGDLGEPGFQLYCKTASGKTFKVSSGLTAIERDAFAENPPCGRRAKVKYLVLSSDGIPLNATILAILP